MIRLFLDDIDFEPSVTPGARPKIIPPHELSRRLLLNLVDDFSRAGNADLFKAISRGLNVANFLNDSSEYVYAFHVGELVLKKARSIRASISLDDWGLRYEYEAMCT